MILLNLLRHDSHILDTNRTCPGSGIALRPGPQVLSDNVPGSSGLTGSEFTFLYEKFRNLNFIDMIDDTVQIIITCLRRKLIREQLLKTYY